MIRTPLTELAEHPLTRKLAAAGEQAVPLRDAGEFLGLVGETLAGMVAGHSACAVLTGHEALSARRAGDGWEVAVRDAIQKYQPALSVHGHIHESRGIWKPGRTLSMNPGSSYNDGVLQGAVIELNEKKGKVVRHLLVNG